MIASIDSSNSEDPKKARQAMMAMMGPGQVDSMVRHAVQQCWMMLPEGRQNIQELGAQLQRILDRAIKDFNEDAQAFGQDPRTGG